MIPTDKRIEKFKSIISKKQFDLGIVLENVHNPHNIGAVLRSCDAVGVLNVYLIYTSDRINDKEVYEVGRRSAKGADKWLKIHQFDSLDACMKVVKKKYDKVFATNFTEEASSLYELDLEKNIALVFGNESEGITPEMMNHVDGNFIIPQEGMAQSLNISVACAVSLYEARRQRAAKGYYSHSYDETNPNQQELLDQYIESHGKEYRERQRKYVKYGVNNSTPPA